MPDGPGPRDDHLQELLQSPLDDVQPARPRWLVATLTAAIITIGIFGSVQWLTGGGGTASTTSTSAVDATITTVPAGPEVLMYGEMAQDPETGLLLLVGGGVPRRGFHLDELSLDTFALDLTDEAWGRLETTGDLPPRVGHALAFDRGNRTLVVFGGHGDTDLLPCANSGLCAQSAVGDTWMLDLASSEWSEARTAGPDARYGSAMAYDPGSGRVILFGGATASANRRTNGFLDDTWAFDPDAVRWERLDPPGAPPPRGWHELLYDPTSRRMILFGGVGDSPESTWAFDPSTDTWEEIGPDPLAERWGIAAAVDGTGTIHAIGGGGLIARETGAGTITEMSYTAEIWMGADGAWTRADDFAGEIAGGAAAYDGEGDRMIVYTWRTAAVLEIRSGQWSFIEQPEDGHSGE